MKPKTSSPWEKGSDLGIWKGIYQTFNLVLFSPGKFFSNMTHTNGIKEPLAFGLLLGSMGTMFGFFWQFLVMSGRILSPGGILLDKFDINLNLIFLGIMIISPFLVILNMLISGSIIHMCLLILRGDKSGFEGTFRVIAFSQATRILDLIPFVGELIGGIWNLVVLIVGIRNIHDTSYFKTIVAIMVLLFLKILILLPVFLIKLIGSSLGFLW